MHLSAPSVARYPRDMSRACAHCGELFADDRLACPHCGADADLTWSEAPDSAFADPDEAPEDEYDAFLAREFGASSETRWVPLLIGIVVVALLIWLVAS